MIRAVSSGRQLSRTPSSAVENVWSTVQNDEMPRVSFQDVAQAFDHVDDPDVIEKAKTNPALWYALEISRPRNWRGTGIQPDRFLAVATESGIPVAWVPPASVLKELASATPTDRMAIVHAHASDILTQCGDLLSECSDEWLGDARLLVRRAIQAFHAGHHEAAMALAVIVGEPLALWASVPHVQMFESEAEKQSWAKMRGSKKYDLAKIELAAVGPRRKLDRAEVLRHALIAPIPRFFRPFHASPGKENDTLSRHATVHGPSVNHLTTDNALLAIMLCISILREQQAWCEEVRDEEAFAEQFDS